MVDIRVRARIRDSLRFKNDSELTTGYVSDDEASDCDQNERQCSGRTRSSTRKANQSGNSNNSSSSSLNTSNNSSQLEQSSKAGEKKRKRITAKGDDNSGSESDGEARKCLKTTNEQETPIQEKEKEEEQAKECCCPRNVMRCIGILPSLPIMNDLIDSDDSSSSPDDHNFTVLPIVSRTKHETGD